MMAQMKVVSDTAETTINAVKSGKEQANVDRKPVRECWNCGRKKNDNI